MRRVHSYRSECLEAHLSGPPGKTAARIVQLQKCLVQMSLDGGALDNAALLWPGTNPYQTEELGGTADEMAKALAYRKAIADLKLKTKNPAQDKDKDGSDEEAAETADPARPKTGGGRRGRGRGAAAAT